MAAPVLAVIIGILTGTGATTYGPVIVGAAKAEAGAAIAFKDIRAACPIGKPLLDLVAIKAGKKHKGLITLARMNDALCLAVQKPDTPWNQALAVEAVIAAIKDPNAVSSFVLAQAHNQRR